MKRLFVPTRTGADWQLLLAKPILHWKPGASAMTAAAAWEAASDKLPPEISTLLNSAKQPDLTNQRLLVAFPEWQVDVPGGVTTSSTDVLAICRNEIGLCVIGVEAKVLEDFGPLLSEKRAAASSGQSERIKYLETLLGVERFEDSIRYQLLHRTASALLTAEQFHAGVAVMLVHAFGSPVPRREDFNAFQRALRGEEVASLVYRVPREKGPVLYLAWCDGDAHFRNVVLPNAI
jgi:hypothetical protein